MYDRKLNNRDLNFTDILHYLKKISKNIYIFLKI
jgi:hypothetical protein